MVCKSVRKSVRKLVRKLVRKSVRKLVRKLVQNKNAKEIKRLKKENDILSQDLLTLHVQFDDLKEFLEKDSKRHNSTLKSNLREIKTILKELIGTPLSFHHEPSTSKQQQTAAAGYV